MSAPYSADLRSRVVAARFDVGTASVKRWTALVRKTGSVSAKPHNGGPRPKVRGEGVEVLKRLVAEHPDWIREELTEARTAETGIRIGEASSQRALKRGGITRRERTSSPPNETRHAFGSCETGIARCSRRSAARGGSG